MMHCFFLFLKKRDCRTKIVTLFCALFVLCSYVNGAIDFLERYDLVPSGSAKNYINIMLVGTYVDIRIHA